MPTPNTSSPVEASSAQPDSSRPTRPQLACPEDIVAPTPTQEQPTTRTDSLTPSDAEVTTPASVEESPQTTESDRAETMSPAPAPCPETVSAEIVVSTVAVASPTTSLSPTSPKAMQSPKDGVGRKKAATVDGLVAGTRRSLVGTASQTDTHIPWVSGPTHDISNRRVSYVTVTHGEYCCSGADQRDWIKSRFCRLTLHPISALVARLWGSRRRTSPSTKSRLS